VKVSDGDRFCADPGRCAALLLHGDPSLVAVRRDAFARAHGGDRASGGLVFERIAGDALRRDPSALDTVMRARGFFETWRCVLVEGASDGVVAETMAAVDLAGSETALIVTAPALKGGSKLRKAFEAHRTAAAIGCWPEPPSMGDVMAFLRDRGVREVSEDGEAALRDMAAGVERGAFWSEIDKLALYIGDRSGPVTAEDVRACGPIDYASQVDAVFEAVAARAPDRLRSAMARLEAQGVGEETVLALGLWRFRTLLTAHAIMQAQGCGAEAALGRLSPPIRWPRSEPMARQLKRWRAPAIEHGFGVLLTAQAALRRSPSMAKRALVERTLLRLAVGGG
jgi:DNA polymerase-3 subunit delta